MLELLDEIDLKQLSLLEAKQALNAAVRKVFVLASKTLVTVGWSLVMSDSPYKLTKNN